MNNQKIIGRYKTYQSSMKNRDIAVGLCLLIILFCLNMGCVEENNSKKNLPPIVNINAKPEVYSNTTILFNAFVEDPDGDMVYASCNIGSYSRGHDGYYIWRFLTHFPGLYKVEIIFYDVHGGYSSMEFQVDVEPWWSY